MFDIYSHPDTWYVMDGGRDDQGCGRSLQFPCNTLLYLLHQIPPDEELHIVTDKSLVIDQQTAVSTIDTFAVKLICPAYCQALF